MRKGKNKVLKKLPEYEEDRISGLPDAVLCNILAYLPSNEAVRTSVLSKRWESVWTYVQYLDLDDSLLPRPEADTDQAIHTSFINFLNKVLNLHTEDSLECFALKCSKFDSFRVNEWIKAALRRRVNEIDLFITENKHFNLAVPLFASQHLVDLKLGEKFILNIPGRVLLPCLKKLHLESIEFSNDESCHKLLSGCPVLEDLHIDGCGMQNVKTLQVVAPALKSFMIKDYEDDIYPTEKYEYLVIVDAPNLESLRYECYMAKGYCFTNLNSLTEAHIGVDLNHVDQSKISYIREATLQLLGGIVHAETITFTGYSLETLSKLDRSTLPVFNELTKLVLGGNNYCGMLLPQLLHNSPVLENLIIDEGIAQIGTLTHFVWHDKFPVARCLVHSLKSVEIWGFDGHVNVLKLIKYLHLHGKVLRELKADRNKEAHEELKVSKRLVAYLK